MKGIPLYRQIMNEITGQIQSGRYRPGDRIPSEKELSVQYRVSQITSKNALNALTDDGVIVRIQGKGSFVAAHAGNLPAPRSGPSGLIGVLLPSLTTQVEFRLLYYLEKYIDAHGYQMVMHNCHESAAEETRAIRNFLATPVDGLIIFPVLDEFYNEAILRLSLDKFPLVLLDRYLKGVSTHTVTTANADAACQAVSSLISRGHRKIACISPEITNSATEDRALGFERAFSSHKLAIDKSLWCALPLKTIDDGEDARAVQQFFSQHPDITAVLTVNLRMYHSARCALTALNLPAEILTFDEPDDGTASYVLQDYDTLCNAAVRLLHQQISGSEGAPVHLEIPARLVLRP